MPHFSDEAIELAAMGRLHNSELQKHLDECPECTGRVAEHCGWIATLKSGLLCFTPLDVMAMKSKLQTKRYILRIRVIRRWR